MKKFIGLFLLITLPILSVAQESDTIIFNSRYKILNNVFNQYLESISKDQPDYGGGAVLNSKSENPYIQYQGKIIRNIKITQIGFEKTLKDTARTIDFVGTRIMNFVHVDTKNWVIRENLFIRENDTINAFLLADNERFLRQLPFIQDTRILIVPIEESPDSVDLEVIAKDLFTLVGSATALNLERYRVKIRNENFGGMGQRIELINYFDNRRTPKIGQEILYTKNNIGGTFVNGSLGFSNIKGSVSGRREEKEFRLILDKPLITPYSRIAASIALSRNYTENKYNTPPEEFFLYKSDNVNLYFGYNLDAAKPRETNNSNKNRKFIGLRVASGFFNDIPDQFQNVPVSGFNNRRTVLGQFTLFNQDFYKTQYIYGFGTTEDVPYGQNLSFITGFAVQGDLYRQYLGVDFRKYIISPQNDFIQLFIRSGSFYENDNLQDVSFLAGITTFSRLLYLGTYKMRQYIRASYSQVSRRVTTDPLFINNNPFGIRDYSFSPFGIRRLTLNTESYVFLKRKFFGFKFSPFIFADLSLLQPENETFTQSNLYSSLGAGVRTRNENFIFGTIELRLFYFPREIDGFSNFKILVRSNIRFRYRSNYVNAPDFIQLNQE